MLFNCENTAVLLAAGGLVVAHGVWRLAAQDLCWHPWIDRQRNHFFEDEITEKRCDDRGAAAPSEKLTSCYERSERPQ